MKSKTGKTIVATVVIMVILGGLIFYSFYKRSIQVKNPDNDTTKTEAEKLLNKDILGNYPKTPKEVLKLYGRITKCLYNEKLSEEDFNAIAKQLRLLFDHELLENNPESTFLTNMAEEVKLYQENKQVITEYQVDDSKTADYDTIEGEEYATLQVTIMTKGADKESIFQRSVEQFLLRKDANENWKILHWKLVNPEKME